MTFTACYEPVSLNHAFQSLLNAQGLLVGPKEDIWSFPPCIAKINNVFLVWIFSQGSMFLKILIL